MRQLFRVSVQNKTKCCETLKFKTRGETHSNVICSKSLPTAGQSPASSLALCKEECCPQSAWRVSSMLPYYPSPNWWHSISDESRFQQNIECGFAWFKSLKKPHTMEYIWYSHWGIYCIVRAKSDKYLTYVLNRIKKKGELSPFLPLSCTSPINFFFFYWGFTILSIFSILLFFILLRLCICVLS